MSLPPETIAARLTEATERLSQAEAQCDLAVAALREIAAREGDALHNPGRVAGAALAELEGS